MSSVTYNPDDRTATCGSGATWKDVICTTNAFGRSPRTLQSYAATSAPPLALPHFLFRYCSFSVGGSMGANAHGITTDYALAESILSFDLVTCSGDVIECSRRCSLLCCCVAVACASITTFVAAAQRPPRANYSLSFSAVTVCSALSPARA